MRNIAYEIISNRIHFKRRSGCGNLELDNLHEQFQREQLELISKPIDEHKLKRNSIDLIEKYPEGNLIQCINWAEMLKNNFDRGLHACLSDVVSPNGLGIVLHVNEELRQLAFVSGDILGKWPYMTAKPDASFQSQPEGLEHYPALREKILTWPQRPKSYLEGLYNVALLNFIPEPLNKKLLGILENRDHSQGNRLSNYEIMNIAIFNQYFKRYRKLIDELYLALSTEQQHLASEMFNFLSIGLAAEDIYMALGDVLFSADFAKKSNAPRVAKSSVFKAVEKYFRENTDAEIEQLKNRLTSLIIKHRSQHDPRLYRKVHTLAALDEDQLEMNSLARQLFDNLKSAYTIFEDNPSRAGLETAKIAMFKMAIELIKRGEYSKNNGNKPLSKFAITARQLLAGITLQHFSISSLIGFNKHISSDSYAKDVAVSVDVKNSEIRRIVQSLSDMLYPHSKLIKNTLKIIQSKYYSHENKVIRVSQEAYQKMAIPLMANTNYVFSNKDFPNEIWQSIHYTGRQLNIAIAEKHTTDEVDNNTSVNWVLLFPNGSQDLFSRQTSQELVIKTCYVLYTRRITQLYRSFFAARGNQGYERHRNRMFNMFYQFVTKRHNLRLSKEQLGIILINGGIIDKKRLKKYGFEAESLPNRDKDFNPLLEAYISAAPQQKDFPALWPSRLKDNYDRGCKNFKALCADIARRSHTTDEDALGIAGVISQANLQGIYNFNHPQISENISNSQASLVLLDLFEKAIEKYFSLIVDIPTDNVRRLDVFLRGDLAYLCLIEPQHLVKVKGIKFEVVIIADWEGDAYPASKLSKAVTDYIEIKMNSGNSADPVCRIKQCIDILKNYQKLWKNLVQSIEPLLLAGMLNQTIIEISNPAPPSVRELKSMTANIICLINSRNEERKFTKMLGGNSDCFMTLSEVMRLMWGYATLGKELKHYRQQIASILRILAEMKLSPYDSPKMSMYKNYMSILAKHLTVEPEKLSLKTLNSIQSTASTLDRELRNIHIAETTLPPVKCWLSKLNRRLNSNGLQTNFVRQLYDGSGKQFANAQQSYSIQNNHGFNTLAVSTINFSNMILSKQVFVASPYEHQVRNTLHIIDQILRIRGIFTPILVDISNSPNAVKSLCSRIPPHRIFDLSQF